MILDENPDIELHRRRRQRILDGLGEGWLLLRTAPEATRNGDVHHAWRPGSDFLYLTGFDEPGALLLASRTGRGRHRAILFVRPRDPAREIWDGRRHGVAGARRRFGVDEAFPADEFLPKLLELVPPGSRLFHRLGECAEFDRKMLEAFARKAFEQRKRCVPAHPAIVDPSPALALMRRTKDGVELAALRRAAAITVSGHRLAMAVARPGLREYEVQAVLEAEFKSLGSPRTGYGSIVASGANACVLHYVSNDRVMRDGDLLLVDAGAEYSGLTADVTRTFPVNGSFTPAQRAVYEVVLRAELAGIRAAREGARWDAPHRACVRELTKGLVRLGVLRGSVPALVAKEKYKPFFMHGTSHWLGRDVHDVGAYEDESGRPIPLRRGMVLTVEPGLYFGARDRRVPEDLRGIGIRIEDDVLVTASGRIVLTESAPKTVRDVERACSSGRSAARKPRGRK
ncbi:MAG: Xaa-Pro aminopeptidase [Planctomycetota bacterium]